MRIGAFELNEPLPELREPHALAMLRPWVDVGNVGTLTLSWLEAYFNAKELGRLVRPGNFFDFTRYRPTTYFAEEQRRVIVPNAFVTYAKREKGNDFLFLHLLEPHVFAEVYVDSISRLLARFGVKRYCLIGSRHDIVPHTKPLIVTGGGMGKRIGECLEKAGILPSDYEGPTTIAFLISQRAFQLDIETMSLIVHLPQYTRFEKDYMGRVRLMEVLGSLYNIPKDDTDIQRAEQQRQQINAGIERDPELKAMIAKLESYYEARTRGVEEEEMPQLPPEVDKFLRELDRRFRER